MKQCKLCNGIIESITINQKYCSKKCVEKADSLNKLKWAKKHKQSCKLSKYNYYIRTKKKWSKYNKDWRKAHPDYKKVYEVNRRKTDINHKIIQYLRNRLWFLLRQYNKSKHALDLLGCSLNYLRKYLEKQFKTGMAWNNYGRYGWHIDHIIPCCTFDLSKINEQKKCFNYTNLQPLWAKENLSKGGKK